MRVRSTVFWLCALAAVAAGACSGQSSTDMSTDGFNRTCSSDSQCAVVPVGDSCTCCPSTFGAVAVWEQNSYLDELHARASNCSRGCMAQSCNADCVVGPGARCVAGTCTACATHDCSDLPDAGADAGPEAGDASPQADGAAD